MLLQLPGGRRDERRQVHTKTGAIFYLAATKSNAPSLAATFLLSATSTCTAISQNKQHKLASNPRQFPGHWGRSERGKKELHL